MALAICSMKNLVEGYNEHSRKKKKKNQGYSTIVFESNWTSISHMHLDDTRILEQMQTALSLCCFGHNASRVQQGSALGPAPFGNEWVRV